MENLSTQNTQKIMRENPNFNSLLEKPYFRFCLVPFLDMNVSDIMYVLLMN